MQQHERENAAAGDEDDGRERKPPAAHRGDDAEERGDRERQKHDGGKNDESEDAIEGAESQHGKSHSRFGAARRWPGTPKRG